MSKTDTIDHVLTSALRSQMPLAATMKVSAIEGTVDRVTTTASWDAEFCGSGGVLHGGYLMALADGTGATLAFLNLDQGSSTTTVESKTNFFRPVTRGDVRATSSMVHRGRTTIVVQTDITNDSGTLVCRTSQTQIIRRQPNSDTATTNQSKGSTS